MSEVILLSLTKSGQVNFINPNGARIIGWDSEELLGLNWFEYCVPEDSQHNAKQAFDWIIGGNLTEISHRYPVRAKAGNRTMVSWKSKVRNNEHGVIVGIYATGTEVRCNVESEQDEQTSAAKYRAIVNAAADAIITSDAKGIITSFNKSAEEYFGYRSEEIIGRNIAVLTPESHRSQHDQYIRNYLDTGMKKIIGIGREVIGRRKDGSEFPIELAVTEAKVGQDRIFAAIIRDITERKCIAAQLCSRNLELQQLQEQLFHLDRLHIVDEMASGVAHEMNQPLTAIINYASTGKRLAEENLIDRKGLLDIIGRIDQQAQRAADIVRMLRNMMKKRAAKYERVNLIQLIQNAIELVSSLNTDARDVSISTEWPDTAIIVEVDVVQIQQVVLNLINNSLDALSSQAIDHKTIDLKITTQGNGFVRLSIHDNGPGVTPSHRSRLFESFFSTKADGLGLGLTICRSVAAAHGGDIHYNANCTNGAEFSLDLPIIMATT